MPSTKPKEAEPSLHQVEATWSPYERLGRAKSMLRGAWRRLGFSRIAATTLRYELDMALLRGFGLVSPSYRRQVRALSRRRELRVHLGCGNALFPGWINLDCYPPRHEPGVEVLVLDMRRGLPLAEASVRSVYSEHFFEHVPFEIVRHGLVPEMLRILEPGGVARIGVPDGEYFAKNYVATRQGQADPLYVEHLGSRTPMEMLNDVVHGFTHHFLYDYETLETIFREAGFVDLRRGFAHDSRVEDFRGRDRKDPWRERMTLYIEGQRPVS